MKVITTNLLNRFWKNGVKPIKDAVELKFDTSKILKSANITEEGFVMDGKTVTEQFAELNGKIDNINKYNESSLTEQYDAVVFTPQSGTTHQGSSYQKIGTKVILHLSIKQVGSGTKPIFTLPSGYRPVQTLAFMVSDGTAYGTAGVTIDASGNIKGNTSSGYIIGDIEFYAMN